MSLIEAYITAVAEFAEQAELPDDVKRDLARAANRIIQQSGEYYRLHHDFETYCDISLPDVGAAAYASHPSLEVLMAAYAFNDEEVLQWLPAEGEEMPAELREAMLDKRAIKFAWNKPFEWAVWTEALDMETPHNQWRDPMVLAFSLSLPGKLAKAGEVVGLPEEMLKMKEGTSLIRTFCAPNKPTKKNPQPRILWHHEPVKWEMFKLYNRKDVVAERAVYKRLRPFDMPRDEWKLWFLDQKINQAGIPISMPMVKNAINVYEDVIANRIQRMKQITGLDNPNSTAQLLGWLQERGYPFEDLKKGHVERGRERLEEQFKEGEFDDNPELHMEMEEVLDVLRMRLEVAAASPKKYYALERSAVPHETDGHVLRNAFQFCGAGRTWRWAGRIFQAQNLPRPDKTMEKQIVGHVHNITFLSRTEIEFIYPEPMKLLKSTIRPTAQAPSGYVFIDADLNAIENRVLGWMSGCSKILKVFLENRDPYIDFATYMFGIPYDELYAEYKAGDSGRRTIAKPGVLGCGYMLGAGEARLNKKTMEIEATGLLGYAWDMQIKSFTEEQSKLSVETFRREYKEVVDFWYAIDRAARNCVRTGKPQQCGPVVFEMKNPFLRMILPSGRALHYCRPTLTMTKTPWGKMKETLTYEGLNDKNQWMRISTHPGKLTENADQAISRDLLAHGMRLADEEGIDIRIHVHDQIVGLALKEEADEKLKLLRECMGDQPIWARGLPLAAAGFTSPIFIKD